MSIHSLLKLDPTTRIPAMQLQIESFGSVAKELAVEDGFREESFSTQFYSIVKYREFVLRTYRVSTAEVGGALYRNGVKTAFKVPVLQFSVIIPNIARFYGIFVYRADDEDDLMKELCLV